MSSGILQQITEEKVWENFLAHRLIKGRFNWHLFEKADSYVENHDYIKVAQSISEGAPLGFPTRIVINKIGTGKKRIVYRFPIDQMRVLKLIAHLLYKYDEIFSPNCFAFRRGLQAGDAINRINSAIKGKRMWAYKVDIHDYFNSISIPLLLPILSEVLKDDPPLYNFFRTLLDDNKVYSEGKIIEEQRGVMAGLPTASFLANVYLKEIDHYFHSTGIIYARYSDDIILFAEDRKTLDKHRTTLMSFFDKYQLTVNPSKEHIYAPGEPYEFLGFRCLNHDIDISHVTIEKMKGKIRRKARTLRRWLVRKKKDPEVAAKAFISCFNRKFFEMGDEDSLCWSCWFFPIINKTEGLSVIDHCLQDYCRYIISGRHNKTNYKTRYANLKSWGYRSLKHEFYLAHKQPKC